MMSSFSAMKIVKVFVESRVDEVLLRVKFVNTSGICFRKGMLTVEMPTINDADHEIVMQEETVNVVMDDDSDECLLGMQFIDHSGLSVGRGILHMKTAEGKIEDILCRQFASDQMCELFCPCHQESSAGMYWESVADHEKKYANVTQSAAPHGTQDPMMYKVEKTFNIDAVTKLFTLVASSVTIKFQDHSE